MPLGNDERLSGSVSSRESGVRGFAILIQSSPMTVTPQYYYKDMRPGLHHVP